MTNKLINTLIFLGVFFAGCSTGSINFFKNTDAKYPAKPDNCDFKVVSTAPQEKFAEVGTINLSFGNYGNQWADDVPELKEKIRHHVCANGGDAVIALLNGLGKYVGGTVIKFTK